jgi:hypothetical protein
MNKSQNRGPAPNLQVIEFPHAGQSAQWEEEVEARLGQLTSLVKDLCAAGYAVLLVEGTEAREAFDELRVKEAALRWIVRVAKRSSGSVREKLWADVEGAVSELEQTADSLMQPQGAETRSANAGETCILDGNGRIWLH